MRKISTLSIVVSVFSVLTFANAVFADWDSEPIEANQMYYEEQEQVWPMPYESQPIEQDQTQIVEEYQEQVWPLPYTDSYTDVDTLADVYPEEEVIESSASGTGWTGGPSYTPPGGNPPVVEGIIPPSDSNMPLANKELVVDDGVRVLSASMPPGYPLIEYVETKEIVQETEDNQILQDSVRDWIAKEGMTLREVLQQWADMEGWELAWNTKREYPLKASAIFRGRFKDVSAALIRNFSRATPQPLAKFYLGNRVLVIKTLEENDAN